MADPSSLPFFRSFVRSRVTMTCPFERFLVSYTRGITESRRYKTCRIRVRCNIVPRNHPGGGLTTGGTRGSPSFVDIVMDARRWTVVPLDLGLKPVAGTRPSVGAFRGCPSLRDGVTKRQFNISWPAGANYKTAEWAECNMAVTFTR